MCNIQNSVLPAYKDPLCWRIISSMIALMMIVLGGMFRSFWLTWIGVNVLWYSLILGKWGDAIIERFRVRSLGSIRFLLWSLFVGCFFFAPPIFLSGEGPISTVRILTGVFFFLFGVCLVLYKLAKAGLDV